MAVPKWLIECLRTQPVTNHKKSSKYLGVIAIPKRFKAQLYDPTIQKRKCFGDYESELNAAMRVDEVLWKQGRYDKMNCYQFPEDFPLVCWRYFVCLFAPRFYFRNLCQEWFCPLKMLQKFVDINFRF